MKVIKVQILDVIKSKGNSWVFSACDFNDIANQKTINDALATLSKKDLIRKLGRGLYYLPVYSTLLQDYGPPDSSQVVQAWARKNNYPLLMGGMAAANSLGLTNAVPAQNIYFSDIHPTKVSIAGWSFSFQKAGKKRLYWVNHKGARVIQALWWLGKDILAQNKTQIIKRLKIILPDDVKKDILDGFKLKKTPSWMKDVILGI